MSSLIFWGKTGLNKPVNHHIPLSLSKDSPVWISNKLRKAVEKSPTDIFLSLAYVSFKMYFFILQCYQNENVPNNYVTYRQNLSKQTSENVD
jgi:hypothetical protein